MCLCCLWNGVVFSKVTRPLTIQERAKGARYKMRNSIVLVQRRWGACKDRHEMLHLETIRRCRAKLMITASVNEKKGADVHSQVGLRRR